MCIRDSYNKYNKYPESIGIVLWGFETMKTGGDTIATILSLLGVEIQHKKNPWFKELKIIPLEQLNRPRIDVVITICGIFRDTFSTHIDLLNRAIEMVANLDEDPEKNYIRKHYLQMKSDLKDLALARIFGPSPTEYATSVRTLIENGCWENEIEIVNTTSSFEFVGRLNLSTRDRDILLSAGLLNYMRKHKPKGKWARK